MARTGRRPGSEDTREKIRAAAQIAFAEAGFDSATIRGIARQARVDPALVHHYFGTKERLFVASMQLPVRPEELRAMLVAGGLDELGDRMARFALSIWRDPASRRVMIALARSATSDEGAAAVVRGVLETTFLPALRDLALPDAELRAALAWAQIVGVLVGRYVVRLGVLAEVAPERLGTALGALLQAALTGPIDGGAADPPAA